jgi:hypothetical protein
MSAARDNDSQERKKGMDEIYEKEIANEFLKEAD